MSAPEPGSPEWQEALNRQIAEHDRQQRESVNDSQKFEIAGGAK